MRRERGRVKSHAISCRQPSWSHPSNTLIQTYSSEEAESQCRRANREAAELAHIRSMARKILDQRSEVEHFLLEALQEVKKEVALSRRVSPTEHSHTHSVILSKPLGFDNRFMY